MKLIRVSYSLSRIALLAQQRGQKQQQLGGFLVQVSGDSQKTIKLNVYEQLYLSLYHLQPVISCFMNCTIATRTKHPLKHCTIPDFRTSDSRSFCRRIHRCGTTLTLRVHGCAFQNNSKRNQNSTLRMNIGFRA